MVFDANVGEVHNGATNTILPALQTVKETSYWEHKWTSTLSDNVSQVNQLNLDSDSLDLNTSTLTEYVCLSFQASAFLVKEWIMKDMLTSQNLEDSVSIGSTASHIPSWGDEPTKTFILR